MDEVAISVLCAPSGALRVIAMSDGIPFVCVGRLSIDEIILTSAQFHALKTYQSLHANDASDSQVCPSFTRQLHAICRAASGLSTARWKFVVEERNLACEEQAAARAVSDQFSRACGYAYTSISQDQTCRFSQPKHGDIRFEILRSNALGVLRLRALMLKEKPSPYAGRADRCNVDVLPDESFRRTSART
jgi:hypothetical protein